MRAIEFLESHVKTLDPEIYGEELPFGTAKSIIHNAITAIDPQAKLKITQSPEGYYRVKGDKIRLDFGITADGGTINANIVNAYSSYKGQGVFTTILGQCFKAMADLYGQPKYFGMSAHEDRGHGVWQHIAQKLGAKWEGSLSTLSELFDPKHAMPLQWEVSSNVVYAYGQVKTKHGDVSIDITFANMDKGSWNIEFMVGGSFDVTGGGGTGQVFATVIAGVKKFLTKVPDVHTITFTAEEKSRARMYDTLTKRVAREIGWHVVPFEDMVHDPKYGLVRSHGSFAFAIEKGHAPAHRQAAQKPQHAHWITTYYIYSRDNIDLPVVKVRAKSGSEAEKYVLKTVPEYKGADIMGVFVTKEPIPFTKDLGEVPPAPPKPAPRVLTPLEQKLRDKLGA